MTRRRLVLATVLLVAGLVLAAYRPDLPRDVLEARWATPPSRFVEVLGTEVHVRDEHARTAGGSAPVLVLLHGTASSLHTWDAWAEELGDTYRIVRFDLQGYGLTGPNAARDYSVARQVEVGEALLDRLGLGLDDAPPPMAVAGNSFGGLVAWVWALEHPQRFDRLVLVDAAPPAGARPPDGETQEDAGGMSVLDLARTPGVREVATKLTPRFLVDRGLREVYGDPSLRSPGLVDRYYEMLRAPGNRRALVDALGQQRPSLDWDDVAQIEQPTLVLWGDADRWIPVAHGRAFHRHLPSSELVIYPGVGHLPMEEAPQRSAADVRAFLAPLRSDRPAAPSGLHSALSPAPAADVSSEDPAPEGAS